ncbi:anti-sigma factor family protein [Microvirga aerilata]|uniref:anti-sigma factor family protein n=1 Tax=Microvirga aerilata TaxID=670292 RepID=UPI00364272DB
MFDPITEDDLHAYVDDQLDPTRRIEVEEYLAHNPEAAARVMADLKDRDALRLAFQTELPRPREPLLEAARRLERGLAWRETGLRLRRIAAVVALIGFGWFAHGQVGFGITDSEASPSRPRSSRTPCTRMRRAFCVLGWSLSLKSRPTTLPKSWLRQESNSLPCPRNGRFGMRRFFHPDTVTASNLSLMPAILAECPFLLLRRRLST